MDYKSSVATDEISPVVTDEIEGVEKESITIIDIEKSTIKFENVASFPIEDFFKIPFSHHMLVIEKTSSQTYCSSIEILML